MTPIAELTKDIEYEMHSMSSARGRNEDIKTALNLTKVKTKKVEVLIPGE